MNLSYLMIAVQDVQESASIIDYVVSIISMMSPKIMRIIHSFMFQITRLFIVGRAVLIKRKNISDFLSPRILTLNEGFSAS